MLNHPQRFRLVNSEGVETKYLVIYGYPDTSNTSMTQKDLSERQNMHFISNVCGEVKYASVNVRKKEFEKRDLRDLLVACQSEFC